MLEVILEAKVLLPDTWCSREEYERFSLDDWIDLFEEDLSSFYEDCGGVKGIVKAVNWID